MQTISGKTQEEGKKHNDDGRKKEMRGVVGKDK